MTFHKALLGAAVLATGLITQAMAAPAVVEWNFFGEPGDQISTSPLSSAAHVAGANVQRGAGLIPNAGDNSINSRNWTGEQTDYYSFGFSVDAGFEVDLEILYIATRSSATGPGMLGLYYSGDGYAAALATFVQPGTDFLNSVVDLSALPDLTGSLEFRISQIGTTAANGNPTTGSTGTSRVTDYFAGGAFTNMQFTGDVVPIPEPATLPLLAFALAGLIAVYARHGIRAGARPR